MQQREDLINQLAASMGAGDFARTKYENSRFDSSTGTLYCDGYIITKSVLDEAVAHFTGLRSKCDIKNPDSRKMAMIYQAAIEAIKMMQESKDEAHLPKYQ